jgi:hypothetical protein
VNLDRGGEQKILLKFWHEGFFPLSRNFFDPVIEQDFLEFHCRLCVLISLDNLLKMRSPLWVKLFN